MGRLDFLGVRSRKRMGCAGSKEEEDVGGGGGGKGRGGGGDPAAAGGPSVPNADPRIPMTAKQKYSLVASWKGIHRALEPTGILMFVK